MAKFATIGFTLLVALAIAEASLFDKIHDAVESVTNGVDSLVHNTVSGGQKASQSSSQLLSDVTNTTQATLDGINKEINSITTSIASAASPCSALGDSLKKIFLSVVFSAGTCVTQKINGTISQNIDIINDVKALVKTFVDAGSSLFKCASNVEGFTGSLQSISCINGVLVNLQWQATTHFPTVVKGLYNAANVVNGLVQNASGCVVDKTVNTLTEGSANFVSQIQSCVNARNIPTAAQ